MENGSRQTKEELIAAVIAAFRRMQTDQDLFDEVAAERLGVNRTDLRVMDVLSQEGPMTAGALAGRSGLSRPALTAAVDRLERVGYAARVRGTEDRRQVLVDLTPKLWESAAVIWGPTGEEANRAFEEFNKAELELVARFATRAAEITERNRERLLALESGSEPPPPGGPGKN